MAKFPKIAGIDFTLPGWHEPWGRVVKLTKVVQAVVVMTSINHIIYIIS